MRREFFLYAAMMSRCVPGGGRSMKVPPTRLMRQVSSLSTQTCTWGGSYLFSLVCSYGRLPSWLLPETPSTALGCCSEERGLSGCLDLLLNRLVLGAFLVLPPAHPVVGGTGLAAGLFRDWGSPAVDAEAEMLSLVPPCLGVTASSLFALRRLGPLQVVGQAFLPRFFELFWCRLYPGLGPFGPVVFVGGLLTLAFLALGFLTGGFLAFWSLCPRPFGGGNWKESVKSCGLGGFIPMRPRPRPWAGHCARVRAPPRSCPLSGKGPRARIWRF